jgi:hypothetical protein
LLILSILAATAISATRTRPALDETAFRTRILALHDAERAQVGSAPLRWDEGLARDAAVWADHLASTRSFDHDPDPGDEGENLWMGTAGHYSLNAMVGGWSGEKKLLARMSSWEDDYHAVGHYTQMVWKDTRAVGCAVSRGGGDEYLVCRYDPAGNVMGESPYASSGRTRGGDTDRSPGTGNASLEDDGSAVQRDEGDRLAAPVRNRSRSVTTTSPDGMTTTTVTTWYDDGKRAPIDIRDDDEAEEPDDGRD